MRNLFVLIHRWAGLFTAVFLFIAGLTGAVISWDHELDEWLNPHLFDARITDPNASPLPALELVDKLEAADPKAQVTYFSLAHEPGHTAQLSVQPRLDPATGELYPLDYNQAFLEPSTGEVVGKRFWGRISLDSENLLPFLYKLHYSMHIPDFNNIGRWGVWFMGIVGIVWLFDCFFGFYLTLPQRVRRNASAGAAVADAVLDDVPAGTGRRSWWQRWKPAWQIKWSASAYRINFDVHRAFGLWLWLLLFILAFTSVSMNLGDEVVRPILRSISSLTSDAFDDRTRTPLNKPITPDVSFANAIKVASREAERRGWTEPAGSAFYGRHYGLYAIAFFEPGNEHGSSGMNKMLFVDGKDGAIVGGRVPWEGTAADVFMQLQFPLHSGRIAGIPGRIVLSVLGIVVAILSATGIVIWLKKRQARRAAAWRSRQVGAAGVSMPRGGSQ
ncbi:MAG: PepSY-associated TM helix domain-containing protein [Hyphomicrobium sp.]